MKKLPRFSIWIVVVFLPFFVFGNTTSAEATSPLVGTWGLQILGHWNDGTWHTEGNKITLNRDGTGTLIYNRNDNGTLSSGVENFTYITSTNTDGSLTIWYTKEGDTVAEPSRLMISDDGKMAICDGTFSYTTRQELGVLVKIDTAKTYTIADLSGEYYFLEYQHDSPAESPIASEAHSGIFTFNGSGGFNTTETVNGDGSIRTDQYSDAYSVNPDGSFVNNDIAGTGYLSGDGKVFINPNSNCTDCWGGCVGIKKQDRTYSTADLAGTWACAGFGDYEGTNFFAETGTMICDSGGNCTYSLKVQRSDGSISYTSPIETLSVASDGSFGSSLASGAPSYAGAIGNNGNTLIMNRSFDQNHLNEREIMVAVRCSACSDLVTVPLGSEFPIATTTGSEFGLRAAFDGKNYLVGIEGDETASNNTTAQMLSQTGLLVGSRISIGRTGGLPHVVFDGTNYLVVWVDDAKHLDDDIYGQFISTSGDLVGSPFPITQAAGDQELWLSDPVFDGTNYLVIWTDGRDSIDDQGPWYVYGQIVSKEGSLIGGEIQISKDPGQFPALAFDGTNYLVVWVEDTNDTDYYGQFISTSGTIVGENFVIESNSLPSDNPFYILFDGTRYIVNVQDQISQDAWGYYVRFVDKDGNVSPSKILLYQLDDGQALSGCHVQAFDGTNYLVILNEGSNVPPVTTKGRFYDYDFNPVGNWFTIFETLDSRVPFWTSVMFDDSRYLAVTTRVTSVEGNELIGGDIYGVFISASPVENGYLVTSDLWIRAVINTEEKGPIEAVWQKGGEDTTSAGDRVIWGHFYASPDDVTWGSENNPDLFVKIWFDHYGRLDVNFFHVSVPDIEVYSDYPYDGTVDEQGTTTMSTRYIRQYYESGQSYSEENYEDGNPPSGYSPAGNPFGYSTINDLRIGSMINTVEKGPIDAIWRLGGQDTTSRGDQVVWGHFYASPDDVTWGSQNNPDLFMKIWFDVSGRVDVNFFHVSVPDIEVYSDLPSDGTYDQKGTTIMDNRYIRHEYWR